MTADDYTPPRLTWIGNVFDQLAPEWRADTEPANPSDGDE